METDLERFEKKIDRCPYISEAMPGCWIWRGAKACGYGSFRYKDRSIGAHRVAWELAFGPIPNGLHVCHKCDIPLCVNPDHLFLGTRSDNLKDASQKGRLKIPNGIKHRLAKLSPEKVLEIRQSNLSNNELSRLHGISRAHIWKLRSGQYWK